MRIPLLLLTAALTPLLSFAPAAGQAHSADEAFQRGAGAYFSGRRAEADKSLTEAIELAPGDPRAYYLRGLNRLQQDDTAAARIDLAEGARLEARRGGSQVRIDRALAGVQGESRLMLERIRREGRRDVELENRRRVAQAHRQFRQEREKRVLRTAYHLPLEALASQLTPAQAERVAIRSTESPSTFLAKAPTGKAPTGKAPVASNNPFADDAGGVRAGLGAENLGAENLIAPATDDAGEANAEQARVVGDIAQAIGSLLSGKMPSGGAMGGGLGAPPDGLGGGDFEGGEFGDRAAEDAGDAEMSEGDEFDEMSGDEADLLEIEEDTGEIDKNPF